MLAIGIDIGGTKIAGALVDADGVILREARVPTPATDPDAIAEAVVGLITELSEGQSVAAAGVAAARGWAVSSLAAWAKSNTRRSACANKRHHAGSSLINWSM